MVDKVRSGEGDFGYNARKDCYEHLLAAGVVDPAKVTRVALENAASIAGMFLTTECVIVDKKEENPAPAMPNPGMGGMGGMDPNMFAADQTLTLNANNALVKYILENKDSEHVPMFAEQLYDLARISNQPLSVDDMTKFVKRSNDIMLLLTK